MKTGITTFGTGAFLTAATSALASGGMEDTSGFVVWMFLGFCALIVIGQLLPLVITLWGAKKAFEKSPAEEPLASSAQEEP
jgi:hypothetical protein